MMALAKRGLSFLFYLQNGRGKWTSACLIKQFSSITNLEGSNLTAPSYLHASDSNIEQIMKKDMLIYEDFITKEEETCILEEVEPYMKRLRYEYAHWDDAIHGFRETERRQWTQKNQTILKRVRDLAFPPGGPTLAHVHILDLAKDGYIKPHIDSVKFCGSTIAGLNLLSSAVMRLVHHEDKSQYADIKLSPRCLYIMRDKARYDYTHEILGAEDSKFKDEVIPRERRISVICRNAASEQTL